MHYIKRKLIRLATLFLVVSGIFGPFAPVLVHAAGEDTETPSNNTTRSSRSFREWGVSSQLYKKINKLGSEPVTNLRVPVLIDAPLNQIPDSWGDARSRGRSHEGTDIMAPRGSYVVSPTDAVVTRTGYGTLGGNYVYTANPGGETYYYAHLDSIPKNVKPGLVLKPGDLIGYVGNTGNAVGGAPHLHFGIYQKGKALNPFPRLKGEFSLKERVEALEEIIGDANDSKAEENIVAKHRKLFEEAQSKKIKLGKTVTGILKEKSGGETSALDLVSEELSSLESTGLSRDLTLGSQGNDVKMLQEFLIKENTGRAAAALLASGATGYFGSITKSALAEYQAQAGITPASGYFGSISRAYMGKAGNLALGY